LATSANLRLPLRADCAALIDEWPRTAAGAAMPVDL
jgi:hypothetical protein